MTAKLSFIPCQLTALGRARLLALATAAVLAISAALGASTSRADVGSVYFDADNNAAAGRPSSTKPSPAPRTSASAPR